MEKKYWKKRLGLILVLLAVLVIAVEVITGNALAAVFGRLFCGDRYMVLVDGAMGAGICGFNADMQLIAFCFLMLVVGVVLLIMGRRKKRQSN